MNRLLLLLFLLPAGAFPLRAQGPPWWKANNLRVIQVNLPAYEAATLNPDSLVHDLQSFSVNTLIINAGGIMAFYPTDLDFHYVNPYMKPGTLAAVVEKCHRSGIRVIVRFDFSRVHESIFKAHPDWCYVSPKGERIINTDMYVVSINAPYVQDKAFRIIGEVLEKFPVDGIFLNMPGYQVNNPYEGRYHGIDQNDYDRKAFTAFSGGKTLPVEENKADPVYQEYLSFKKATIEKWSERLHQLVKSRSPQLAICTYLDKHVDIIRHESQTNSLPYWPYSASDNVGNAGNTFPDHVISNASIQQISFQSRYNAVEPEEVRIRLYENIANGSGLDISLMGDLRGYEDERNFPVIREVYAHHKKHERYYGKYTSPARVVVIAPGSWPSGEPMQEYRGLLLMLKEAHIPVDILEDAQLASRADALKRYRAILLPDITYLSAAGLDVLKTACRNGAALIATNRSFSDSPETLQDLFGAKIIRRDRDGAGFYLQPEPRTTFTRFPGQKMLSWKFNLGEYDFSGADERGLPILAKGRPGPPEIIGGHDPTGAYAMGLKNHGKGKAVLLPENLGKLYYLHGYQEHKNLLLDVLYHVYPDAGQLMQTDAPARVETILQNHTPTGGQILHLINLTGFSGNTYFPPLPVRNLSFRIRTGFRPPALKSLKTGKPVAFSWKDNILSFRLPELGDYDAVIIESFSSSRKMATLTGKRATVP
ncbi:MAG: family 10 glycosylhydrolase [Siphonobacter aquaeclarae]|nr:family 10 glycosylhydrolase [Siphonobacter aquaeclarae]